MITDIEIKNLLTNCQTRCATDEEVVADYAEKMMDGCEFPPVIVFSDKVKYWLADGYHRTRAAERNGSPVVKADIRQGGFPEALAYSLSANVRNGLRLTNADKRRNVRLAWENRIDLGLGQNPSNRMLARMAGVNHKVVQLVFDSGEISRPVDMTRTGSDGRIVPSRPIPPPPQRRACGESLQIASANNLTPPAPSACPPPPPTRAATVPPAPLPPIPTRSVPPPAPVAEEPTAYTLPTGETYDKFERKTDRYGIPMNELAEQMERGKAFRDKWSDLLQELYETVETGATTGDAVFSALNASQLLGYVGSALRTVKSLRPWCVCRMCHGHENMRESCKACHGRGWQTRDEYGRNPSEFNDASDRDKA